MDGWKQRSPLSPRRSVAGFTHLEELALHPEPSVYLGKAKSCWFSKIRLAAQSDMPTSGMSRSLPLVLSERQGCLRRATWGTAASSLMSDTNSPAASANRIPVSLISATSHLTSSSCSTHSFWMAQRFSSGIGNRVDAFSSSGMKTLANTFGQARPYSLMARLVMALTVPKTRRTDAAVMPLPIRWSRKRAASAADSDDSSSAAVASVR